jgi:hypothetical protein
LRAVVVKRNIQEPEFRRARVMLLGFLGVLMLGAVLAVVLGAALGFG